MGQGLIQPSFTAGELSPSMYGRIDFARYYTGLKTCRNFIVRQYGGVVNRPGTKYVAETKGSGEARLIPFQFNTEQTYVLEFGDEYMRVHKNGATVVKTTSDTDAWQTSHGYVVGDFVKESDVIYYCVTAHTSGTFSVDLAAGKWVAQAVYEIPTPYAVEDLDLLKYSQNADIMTLVHPSYAPMQLSRTGHSSWTLEEFDNTDGPFQDMNTDTSKTVYVSNYTGSVTVTANFALFDSSMIGQLMRIEQAPTTATRRWETDTIYWLNQERLAGTNYYKCLTAPYGTSGTVRPSTLEGQEYDGSPGCRWEYLHSGSGIVEITAVTDAQHATATVVKRLPTGLVSSSLTATITNVVDNGEANHYCRVTAAGHGFTAGSVVTITGVTGTTEANGTFTVDAVDTNTFDIPVVFVHAYVSGGSATKTNSSIPSYKWALEAWGGSNLYPGCTTYYQQRQVFGGSYGFPQDVWFSTVAGFESFEKNNPVLDDDGITLRIVSREVNEIRHFVDIRQLVALTSGGPFVLNGNDNAVVTPTTIRAERQEGYGCSHVRPVVVGKQTLYLQEKGGKVRSLGYSFADDAFVGTDLTILSAHLFDGYSIVDWAYQEAPYSCVWAVRDDGVLLGLTYLPEHEVAAWHRHDTDGTFESICTVSEDDIDALYVVVNRTIGEATKRFIERMDDRDWTSIEDAFFVDCGLTYDGAAATTISGLDHLEGEAVAVLADGFVHPQRTVSSGSITLNRAYSKVHVGLPFTSDIETLEVNAPNGNILDRAKIINSVGMIVEDTVTVWAGPDADNLREYKARSTEAYGAPTALHDGLIEIDTIATWSKQGRVFIRNSSPLPVSILAVIPDVTAGGR